VNTQQKLAAARQRLTELERQIGELTNKRRARLAAGLILLERIRNTHSATRLR
jgi:hypothetical protein